jgi:hypothetical protein
MGNRQTKLAAAVGAAAVVSAWGEHLQSFRWAHFGTLTPEFPDTSAGKLESHFRNHFIRNLARAARRPVPWFYAMERSEGGVLHMHTLLANTEALTIVEMRQCWTLGFTEITRYSARGAAAWYAAKTLDRSNDERERWDVSRRVPARLR